MRIPTAGATVLVAVALLLAGCTSAAKTGDKPDDSAQKAAQYAACLRDHGVAQPVAGSPAPVTDPTVLRAAQAACQQYAQAPDDETAGDLAARRRAAQCMRDRGYADWPDPVPGSVQLAVPRDIDMNSQAVKDALNECTRQGFNSPTPTNS